MQSYWKIQLQQKNHKFIIFHQILYCIGWYKWKWCFCLWFLKILFIRAERENDQGHPNGRVSKLLIPDSDDENKVTLSHPARELCSTVHAFVYVVKANDINKGLFQPYKFRQLALSFSTIPYYELLSRTRNSVPLTLPHS